QRIDLFDGSWERNTPRLIGAVMRVLGATPHRPGGGPRPVTANDLDGASARAGKPAAPQASAGGRVAGGLGLGDLLAGRPGFRDLLGLLTASGGGLALADLDELRTGLASYELQKLLRDCGGLVAARETGWPADGEAAVVYEAASQAVRAEAAAALGAG